MGVCAQRQDGEKSAPRPELPVWATREFSRSLAHIVVMGLGLLAFIGALVWFVTNPARGFTPADPLGHPVAPEQRIEKAEGELLSR